MKKKKNMFLIISSCIIILIFIILYFIGDYFVGYSLERKPVEHSDPLSPTYEKTQEELYNIEINNINIQFVKDNYPPNEIYINSFDGLRLWSNEYINNNSDLWVILVHGYTANHSSIEDLIYNYVTQGYNVLTPDLRAHGNSQGKYIGMGLFDSKDIFSWCDYIKEQNQNAKIVLHGESMGAATVMMTAGENHSNVKVVIEDCGYTNAYTMMCEQLNYRFGLPAFPVMNSASFVGKIKASYDIKDASPINALKNTTTPILFIHGTDDIFVLPYMQTELYESYNGEKDILIVEGAGHTASRNIEPELYYNKVFDFINAHIDN